MASSTRNNRAERAGSVESLDAAIDEVLRDTYFSPETPLREFTEIGDRPGPQRAVKERPAHYKVICISMYTEDLEKLDAAVKELKRRGYTKANRSAVLRAAVAQLDLAKVPRGI